MQLVVTAQGECRYFGCEGGGGGIKKVNWKEEQLAAGGLEII
jgi:hypothetical protein